MNLVSNNRVNFGAAPKIVINGKNNKHKQYLFNEVNDFINDKGITAQFKTGEDRIIMEPATVKMASMIKMGLKKLNIIESSAKK